MRLTLRTLLAYLDNVLEPDDAAEIAKKVEESEVAKALVRRIRELLRKEKLGAPEVLDHRESLDPNTVAEYLDNTLPAEKVADFEKVCLESDVELAEVAACHQILALVLGEPAEVEPALREKMYRLPQVAAQRESTVEQVARELIKETERPAENHPPEQAAAAPTRIEQPFVTNVKERSFRTWFLGLTALLVVGAAVVAGLVAYRNWFPAPPLGLESAHRPGAPQELAESDRPGEPRQKSDQKPSEVAAVQGQKPVSPASPPVPRGQTEKPAEKVTQAPVAQPGPPEPPVTQPLPPEEQPVAAPAAGPVAADRPRELPPAATPAPQQPEPVAGPDLTQPPQPPVADRMPLPPSVPSSPADSIPDTVPPLDVAPLPPEPIGMLVSDARPPQVLFVVEPKRSVRRVMPDEHVKTGDAFFVPPAFRPRLQLAESVELECVGPAFWELLPLDAQGRVGLCVSWGGMKITALAENGAALRLSCTSVHGVLELIDRQTSVGLAVSRPSTCSGDPETQPVPWVIDLYVLGGTARWLDADRGRPIVLRAPVQIRLSETELQTLPMLDQPDWINRPISAAALVEERAMAVLEAALRDPEKDPLEVFQEHAGAKQREISWLARRTLAYLGYPEELWKALNETEQRGYWSDCWSTLRNLVRISPDLAAATRRAAEHILGSAGPLAYGLLWRLPDTEITPEQAEELVQCLDHEQLAVRVGASLTLREITQMTLNYEPHASPGERRRAIELWRERLKSGSVRGVRFAPKPGQP